MWLETVAPHLPRANALLPQLQRHCVKGLPCLDATFPLQTCPLYNPSPVCLIVWSSNWPDRHPSHWSYAHVSAAVKLLHHLRPILRPIPITVARPCQPAFFFCLSVFAIADPAFLGLLCCHLEEVCLETRSPNTRSRLPLVTSSTALSAHDGYRRAPPRGMEP